MVYQKLQSLQSPSVTEKQYWENKQMKERSSIERQVAFKGAVEIVLAYKDKFSFEDAVLKVEEIATRLYTNILYF